MNQMITFNTSLDPEKKTLPDQKTTCVHLKKKLTIVSYEIEDNVKKKHFMAVL
jgi:hypothetical protein